MKTAMSESAEKKKKKKKKEKNMDAIYNWQALFFIAFMGSIDDCTLFVPMLVGNIFNPFECTLGSFIACAIVVASCIFVGIFKPVADCIMSVPLWLILFVFSVSLFVRASMMH